MQLHALALFTLLASAAATPVERAECPAKRDANPNPNPNPEAEMGTNELEARRDGCPKATQKRCIKGGKCIFLEDNCCKGGKTYCPYGYSCIKDGKKCCPVGRWCWPWKRDDGGDAAADAGEMIDALDALD